MSNKKGPSDHIAERFGDNVSDPDDLCFILHGCEFIIGVLRQQVVPLFSPRWKYIFSNIPRKGQKESPIKTQCYEMVTMSTGFYAMTKLYNDPLQPLLTNRYNTNMRYLNQTAGAYFM